jgi:hypothetical protein
VGLEPYKEILAATAGDDNTDVVVLTMEEPVPTLDEIKAALKAEHGIDLDALQASAAVPSQGDLTTALTAALAANPTLGLSSSDEQITNEDVVGAVVELSRQNATLATGYEEMRRERATEVVDGLVGTGHILPKQREFAIKLRLTRPDEFEDFVPAEPVVQVGDQVGFSSSYELENHNQHESARQDGEVARLAALYTDEIVAANQRRRK